MAVLFTPLKFGSNTTSNKIGMSALTRNRSTSTVPSDIILKYYVQRAKGGAGLIVSEAVLITRQDAEWQQTPGIWSQAQIEGWKTITDAVHGARSKIYAQLWHLGRIAHPAAPEQIAAAISARGGKSRFLPGQPGYVTPTEVADPTILIAHFKQAAINAEEAGFDKVERHDASGYLGGRPENRARFALETLKALIKVWGSDVALKISLTGGYNDMRMPLQETIDTFGHLLREADKLGLSYVTLVRYGDLLREANLGLSYVTLVRYNAHADVEFDGKMRATQHDDVGTFSPFLTNTNIFVNSGVTPPKLSSLSRVGRPPACSSLWCGRR
ncbi:Flavin nadh-dependent oxidoreductase [Mycena sanguinolenta]|uniref:Flavin nadh-dependent oxidoreductase n=1 Tax=Mycena sanguinolenta TaxID=230812 RepID=A0A8H6YUG0_9AGAR|nr:Flavin nadh-dependent oxidoreductase [Mycena sanguinolenta]